MRPAGVLSFLYIMAIPFLSIEERIEYLYRKAYLPRDTITDEDAEVIASYNFHYFLGYARNFRMLMANQDISTSSPVTDLLGIIEQDHAISENFTAV